jgi:MYXO-CTERM domain-containing protein
MGGWTIDDVCVYALTDAVSTDPGDDPGDETDPGNDSPGGEVGDYDVPERSGVIEGKRVGCSCASAPDPAQLGWLGLLLTGLITAARRREG